MANLQSERTAERNDVTGRIVRICLLIIVSFVVAIAAVSFAVHHMRLQFENEFKKISDTKMRQVTDIVRMSIDGDDLVSNTVNVPAKYSAVLDLMLVDTTKENLSAEGYGLFGYSQGQLSLLLSHGVNDPSLDEKHIKGSLTKAAGDRLAEIGYDEKYGARPLRKAIRSNIEDPLSDMFLTGALKDVATLKIDFRRGKFVFDTIKVKREDRPEKRYMY